VLITMIRPDDAKQQDAAKVLAAELTARGVDVLIDDRDERPGVKFKDADLIGIPLRLTLGEKGLEAGAVEYKLRRDPGKGELVPMGEVVAKAVGALGG
jgi:prolyl-tRNA synthetase